MMNQFLKTVDLLLVEDELVLSKNVVRYLGRQGLTIAAAASIKQANEWLREHRCRAMVLDIDLPDGCGMDVYEQAWARHPETRLIVTSGRITPAVEVRLQHLDPIAVLQKPFSLARLADVVFSAIPCADIA